MPASAPGLPQAALSAVIATPFSRFGIHSDDHCIRALIFLPPDTALKAPHRTVAELAVHQITRWLADPDYRFNLPLCDAGTRFQRRVWNAISAIPRGQRRRYGELAGALNSAARAVGQACGANPFPLIVPCHRVVAASNLGGFAGATSGHLLEAKRWLLDFEATQ